VATAATHAPGVNPSRAAAWVTARYSAALNRPVTRFSRGSSACSRCPRNAFTTPTPLTIPRRAGPSPGQRPCMVTVAGDHLDSRSRLNAFRPTLTVMIFPTAHCAMRSGGTQGRYRVAPRWTYGPPLTSTTPHQSALYREEAAT